MPRVSVIVPSHNRAEWLLQTLATVEAQAASYTDFEVIVVDDGSTDATVAELERIHWERHSSRSHRLLKLPHSGLPAVARNAGLRVASGEFVAFIDSDDWWRPGKLAQQVAAMDHDPTLALVCGNAFLLQPHDHRGWFFERPRPPAWRDFNALRRFNYVITSTVLARRAWIDRLGGFYAAPDYRIEDYDLWLRLTLLGATRFVAEPVAFYRIGHASVSRGLATAGYWRQRAVMLRRVVADANALGCRIDADDLEREARQCETTAARLKPTPVRDSWRHVARTVYRAWRRWWRTHPPLPPITWPTPPIHS